MYWFQIEQLAVKYHPVDLNDSQNELEKVIMKHTMDCDLSGGSTFLIICKMLQNLQNVDF